MLKALRYVNAPHDKPLYSVLFFDQKVKFQYPPTTVLLFEPLNCLPDRFPYRSPTAIAFFLGILSWLAIAATCIIVSQIFTFSLQRYLNEPELHESIRSLSIFEIVEKLKEVWEKSHE